VRARQETRGEATTDEMRVRLTNPEETRRLAAALGRLARTGDVIGLSGALGAGKTTFVQGLAEGLGIAPERHVASPTFALVNEHPGRLDLVHVDFYRVRSEAELPELGLAEAYDRAVTAIEWAERFPDWLPADALSVRLEIEAASPGGPHRVLEARATGPRSRELAAAWFSAVVPRPD